MDPVDPKYRAQLNRIAAAIDRVFNGDTKPKKVGFAVLLFEFGQIEAGRMNWISNAERSDMVDALMEAVVQLQRPKGGN